MLIGVAGLLALFFAFDLGRFLSLDDVQAPPGRAARRGANSARWPPRWLFFVVYVAVTALSLPGAAILTLAAGAIFGLGWGTLIVSFASSIGATLAFLASRWLLRDWVQSRFGEQLPTVNAGIARDGGFYLFTLRLVPLFPFFVDQPRDGR